MRRQISPTCRRTTPTQPRDSELHHLSTPLDRPFTERSTQVGNATKLSHPAQTSMHAPTRTLAKNNNSDKKFSVERSSKSNAIARELQMLSDDYFGQVQSKAPQVSNRSLQSRTRTSRLLTTTITTTLPSLRGTCSNNNKNTNICRTSNSSTATDVLGSDDVEIELTKSNTFYTISALPASWMHDGPHNPEGELFDSSDSNLLCMDVYMPANAQFSKNEFNYSNNTTSTSTVAARNRTIGYRRNGLEPLCVIGSADHGLRVFNITTMREVKNLYNKSFGHTEWVTTCKFLPSGQVLSGGMDSKLCLWDSVTCGGGGGGPARCRDLLAHTGSISQVEINDRGSVALSASYDRTLRLWDLSRASEVGCLAGHSASVMQFSWSGNCVLSGDRQGNVKLWDINTAQCTSTMNTSKGQVGALAHLIHDELGHLIMYGDQGGVLTVADTRCASKSIVQEKLHSPGVLSGIRMINETPYIVTCGADRRICVLDPRQAYTIVHTFTDHVDYIYSLETLGPLILSGAGNGWVLVHDAVQGSKCCYGLQPHTSAVREMFASPNLLVTAGDDGKACVFHFDEDDINLLHK